MRNKDVSDTFKMGHVNVNSLMNKKNFITDLLLCENLLILGITETWLTPSVSSSFVEVTGYQVVRGDTKSGVRKHGSLLYVHNSVKFLAVDVHIPNVSVVRLVDFGVWVVASYRPPSHTVLEDACLINFFYNFCPEKEIVLIGDFNLPTLDWSQDAQPGYNRPVDSQFLDCFCSLGLTQWVREATIVTSGNILDLVLTSEDDRVGEVRVLPPLPSCSHSPVVFDYIFHLGGRIVQARSERRSWHRDPTQPSPCPLLQCHP